MAAHRPAGIFIRLMVVLFAVGIGLLMWFYQPWNFLKVAEPASYVVSIPVTPSNTLQITWTPFQPLPTSTITVTPTITLTASQTPSPTLTSTPTLTPSMTQTTTSSPTETSQPGVPDYAFIQGFQGEAQLFSLDCEARSAVDLAAYFGVYIDELDFLNALPHSDDPNEGFVGDLNDEWGQIPPNSYGVYANPIARLLRNYGLDAYAHYAMPFDELRLMIASGKPVMVWVIGEVEPGVPLSYTPTNGNRTTVAHNEHTVVIIGYDQDFMYIIDPSFNLFYMRTIDQFLLSWGVLNNMAVVIQ